MAQGDELTEELEAAAIPLNEWGPVGRETTAIEDYAYAASLLLAGLVADRAGDEALQAVWADAAAGVGAYQPPGPAGGTAGAGRTAGAADGSGAAAAAGEPETVDGPPDWRGLLDLLDEHGRTTFDDLWRAGSWSAIRTCR